MNVLPGPDIHACLKIRREYVVLFAHMRQSDVLFVWRLERQEYIFKDMLSFCQRTGKVARAIYLLNCKDRNHDAGVAAGKTDSGVLAPL